MSRITIEQAISHAREVAEKNRANCKRNTIIIPNRWISDTQCAEEHEQFAGWLEELQRYKDLEEQGRLIELPYAVGDMVYVIAPRYVECDKKYNCEDYNSEEYLITWCQNYCPNGYKGKGISPTKIEAIHIIEDGIDLSTTLGRYHIENVFTTREEAESKLAEMEGAE